MDPLEMRVVTDAGHAPIAIKAARHRKVRGGYRFAMPYFCRIVRTLSSGMAGTVRPRLLTVVAMNIEL
jgi:hypothetical protein